MGILLIQRYYHRLLQYHSSVTRVLSDTFVIQSSRSMNSIHNETGLDSEKMFVLSRSRERRRCWSECHRCKSNSNGWTSRREVIRLGAGWTCSCRSREREERSGEHDDHMSWEQELCACPNQFCLLTIRLKICLIELWWRLIDWQCRYVVLWRSSVRTSEIGRVRKDESLDLIRNKSDSMCKSISDA